MCFYMHVFSFWNFQTELFQYKVIRGFVGHTVYNNITVVFVYINVFVCVFIILYY